MENKESYYYQKLYEVAASINSAHTPEKVLHSVVENVAKAMEAKGCSLMLLTPDKKNLMHNTSYGLSDQYIRKGPVSTDKSISEALQGKPVAILNATEDERAQYREEAKQEGIASILSVPILLRDEIIGVIRIYTAKPYNFTMDDMFFVGAVANLGAIAFENSRLYDAVQKNYSSFKDDIMQWIGANWDQRNTRPSL